MKINVLALGDVVGPRAVEYLKQHLWNLRRERNISLAVVNGENACVGNGLDAASAKQLLASGADVITSGNHIWHKKDIKDFLNDTDSLIRPANYRATTPGSGYMKINAEGYVFLVINIMGVVYMDPLENPFYTVERILDYERGRYDFAVLDIHAEATSEKYALARYFDGRVHIMFGTHTHVQTADEQILEKGSGFICDVGMTGPHDSVLGIRNECIIEKLMTNLPVKFEIAEGEIKANGAIFSLDADSGRVADVERFTF